MHGRQATAYHQIESVFIEGDMSIAIIHKSICPAALESGAIETHKAVAFKAQQLESAGTRLNSWSA